MKKEKCFILLFILFILFTLTVHLISRDKSKNNNTIYVSNKEIDTLAAADTLVIRACSGEATAKESEMVLNKTGWAGDTLLTGTMISRPAEVITLNAGESYTIPAGYHNGRGEIVINSLENQTSATAISSDITAGQTAWVNGKMITGTMPIQDSNDRLLSPGDSFLISEGYYARSMLVTTEPLLELTPGTLNADYLTAGQIAWVNGRRIVGNGNENQKKYQEGYNETSGKGSTHLNLVSMEMYVKSGSDNQQMTRASMTLDVTGSETSSYIGVSKTATMAAGDSYQTITATSSDKQCQ